MHRFFLAVGLVGLAGLGMSVANALPSLSQTQASPTNVDVRCADGRVEVTVDPWRMEVQQDGVGEWELNANAGSTTIEITPKRPGQNNWPFQAARHTGGRGAANRARGANMRPNQVGRQFGYNITLECQDGNETHTVVIDPDIIITPGTP